MAHLGNAPAGRRQGHHQQKFRTGLRRALRQAMDDLMANIGGQAWGARTMDRRRLTDGQDAPARDLARVGPVGRRRKARHPMGHRQDRHNNYRC